MNWEMVSAIGEILGSLAVLVTLIYLAIQMRQNASAIQASTRQAILQEDQQLLMRLMDEPELSLLRFKPSLSDEEKIRVSVYLATYFRMRENNWRQHKNGVLDDATWTSYRSSIAGLKSPNVDRWISSDAITRMFDPEFVTLARSILAKAPQSSRPLWLEAFDHEPQPDR